MFEGIGPSWTTYVHYGLDGRIESVDAQLSPTIAPATLVRAFGLHRDRSEGTWTATRNGRRVELWYDAKETPAHESLNITDIKVEEDNQDPGPLRQPKF